MKTAMRPVLPKANASPPDLDAMPGRLREALFDIGVQNQQLSGQVLTGNNDVPNAIGTAVGAVVSE